MSRNVHLTISIALTLGALVPRATTGTDQDAAQDNSRLNAIEARRDGSSATR